MKKIVVAIALVLSGGLLSLEAKDKNVCPNKTCKVHRAEKKLSDNRKRVERSKSDVERAKERIEKAEKELRKAQDRLRDDQDKLERSEAEMRFELEQHRLHSEAEQARQLDSVRRKELSVL